MAGLVLCLGFTTLFADYMFATFTLLPPYIFLFDACLVNMHLCKRPSPSAPSQLAMCFICLHSAESAGSLDQGNC